MYQIVSNEFIQKNLNKFQELDEKFFYNQDSQYCIMLSSEKILGYVELIINSENSKNCEIKRIYIEDSMRYKSNGTKFIKYIEKHLTDIGCEILISKRLDLAKFFEKAGFKKQNDILLYDKILERKKRYSQNRNIIGLSIVGNIILAFTKITFGLSGGSRALFSDGINSLSDVATSIGMFVGVHYSNQPADEAHPYGHERIESVVANVLGIFMILTAFELGKGSLELLYSVYIQHQDYKIPVLNTIYWGLLSAVIKYGMYYYKLKIGKKTSNHALIADAKDSRNDIFTSLGAVVGILLAIYVNPIFDIVLSIPVAVLIFKEGISVIFENANLILDTQDKEFIKNVEEFIYKSTDIVNVHNIQMRTSGDKCFLNLHIRVPKEMSVEHAHFIGDELEQSLYEEFENISEVLIHVEPTMD
ncbi:MAG: GNAT family N-acetyltransferase [Fusobacteriaceae bacterium]